MTMQHVIAGYWRELLGVDAVQPTDHFIQLGGDSMRATMLANRIEDELGIRPGVVELFATLADTARHCEALRYRARGWWRDTTIVDDLRAAASRTPTKPAIIATRAVARAVDTLDYATLARRVDHLASGLIALGVARGDVVAVQLPNTWHYTALALACARIGAVFAPLAVDWRRRELALILERTRARVYVGPATWLGFDHQALIRELAPPALRHRVVVGAASDGALGFDTVLDAPIAPDLDARAPAADDLFLVMYTSGTTGEPKGVMHSYNTLYAICRAMIDSAAITADDVITAPGAMTGLAGFLYNCLIPIQCGATAACCDVGDPDGGLDRIARDRVTFLYAIPSYVLGLVEAHRRRPRPCDTLRLIVTGSAAVPPHLIGAVRDAIAVRVLALWGMTENGGVTFTFLDDPDDWPTQSDGRAIAWMEVDIAEPGPDGAGRLRVRGANQCLGYFQRPDLYAACVDGDGWFETGDLVRPDGRGGIRIVGRIKDVIVRNGYKVPVIEVESALAAHPQIAQIALVADPDEQLGERVCAVAVAHAPAPTLGALRDHLRTLGVSSHYWPDRLHLIDAMPLTSTGKIQKYVLQDQLRTSKN